MQRCQYLCKVLKIFEEYTTELKPTKVYLSYQQIWFTPEENMKWCLQNGGLSKEQRKSYACMFLTDNVKQLMNETRILMNGTITEKKKRNTPSQT